jgi:3-oxoacyl-[acyl-carrier protein] reductase
MKHVLVTGGAKGIGRAIVEDLAAHGYKVTATYHGSKAAADEVKTKFPDVKYLAVDLEDRKDLDAFITQLLKGDPIDVLINNAGVWVGKPFDKLTKKELFQQIDLNLVAPARLMHGLLPVIEKSKAPLIINISSQAVHERVAGEAVYSAVKNALSVLSYVLRAELNPRGVRIVTLEPFAVNTYGIPEPSNMILPAELAVQVRAAIELPDHLQFDNIGISHIKQPRPDYPNYIEQ